MSEVLAIEKPPMEILRPTTRSQSETSKKVSRSRVALFQTPTSQISQPAKVVNTHLENVTPNHPTGVHLIPQVQNVVVQTSIATRDGVHLIPQVQNVAVQASMAATDDAENISTVKKKGRGGAKPWAEWNNDEKKLLEWNEKCQPVCALQSKLMSQLGHYAKNGIYFPLTMLSWDSADESVLKYIWEEVQKNTNAPDGFKPICESKMGAAWKQWKHRVKKDFYQKYDTDEKRLEHCPPRVERNQWLWQKKFQESGSGMCLLKDRKNATLQSRP